MSSKSPNTYPIMETSFGSHSLESSERKKHRAAALLSDELTKQSDLIGDADVDEASGDNGSTPNKATYK